MKARKGQAFMEMAVGMFAFALVFASLLAFASYIIGSLDMQRSLRAEAGKSALNMSGSGTYATAKDSDSVEIEPFAAEYIFGETEVTISEEVHMPAMGGAEL